MTRMLCRCRARVSTSSLTNSLWLKGDSALQLDLPVDHCRRPGLTKRLDQSGHSRMPGDQPRLKLAIDLEIQPCCHSIPPHPAGETYHPPRTKAESTTSLPDWANPEALAGDQGPRRDLHLEARGHRLDQGPDLR